MTRNCLTTCNLSPLAICLTFTFRYCLFLVFSIYKDDESSLKEALMYHDTLVLDATFLLVNFIENKVLNNYHNSLINVFHTSGLP
jgi:hypothetical protein